MREKNCVIQDQNQNFSPVSVVKYLGIAFALVIAFQVFALAMQTDWIQTFINGKPLPRLSEFREIDCGRLLIRDQKKIPSQVDEAGQVVD